ncbi:phosphotransferase [Flindersiella endophytica]
MEPEDCFDIIDREPVEGGHSTTGKEKLRIAVIEDGRRRERVVLLKRTSPAEVEVLQAVNRVPGATALPPLLRSGCDAGGHWIAIPYYAGQPASSEATIPANVAESLAALHAHFLDSGPLETATVIDADWWRAACEQQKLQQFADAGRPALQPLVDRARSWSTDPAALDALAGLPRTLLHGDVHRNNVVVNDGTGRLVDWESGLYGVPQLDLITFGGPGSPGHESYAATWRALTGQDTAAPEWRRGWLVATAGVKLKYLPRGARVSGDDHARRMVDEAAAALTELRSSA